MHERIGLAGMARSRQQVKDHLGIGRRVKDVAELLEAGSQQSRVDQVAVMANSDLPAAELLEQGLGVAGSAGAGRRITVVSDGGHAVELFENARAEHIADQPHAGVVVEGLAVRNDDAGGFLAAMLLRVQAVVGQLRTGPRAPHAEKSALFLLFHNDDRARS